MSKPFDYSKWDNIELSDDEDSHPGAQFIEAQTLRRIKRENHEHKERERLAKIETLRAQKSTLTKEIKENERTMVACAEALENVRDGDAETMKEMKERGALAKASVEEKRAERSKIESEIAELERAKKFNAEEMCYVSAEKTLVGAQCKPEEEERVKRMSYEEFTRAYEKDLDEIASINGSMSYGEMGEWFSNGKVHLLGEHATGYLLLKALYLEMEKKTREARTCARVAFACKSIGEFAEAGKKSDRDAAEPFFKRLDSNSDVSREYERSFEEYFEKLQERALVKLREEAEKEQPMSLEDVPVEERLGPGGMDPVAVYDSLPQEMRDAFDSGSVDALKAYVNTLPMEEARKHMKAMVDSGLWVPTPGEDPGAALR
ncbi:Cdc37, C-terminal [Ostreococcus tauri]|uniref:Hsp90 chaperone protein kinase-targeting subunit n=1 Tax=Ostreococcus tauri TaxID=70448 RepID=A0A090MDT2_OSTTA|nr:Cdc37, C-terminal [Ostreococcus tauri]CEG01091.1 Cdc37, C-terminal [Ostreococcus tauri]|eukprot:XP_003075158.2 Cdc37, C-terminal [Ostreococcus tauri]